MKYFESRIKSAKRLPTFMRIAEDLQLLRNFEELENLLAKRAGVVLESNKQMKALCESLAHDSSQNLFLLFFHEDRDRKILTLDEYATRSEMVNFDAAFGFGAQKAIDTAAWNALQITPLTPLEHLEVMAQFFSDYGNNDEACRSREDQIIEAALDRIGYDCEQAVDFSNIFPMETSRNRFRLAFVRQHGVEHRATAEMLSRGFESDENFGAELKAAIWEAAAKAGFEFDPNQEIKRRRNKKDMEFLISILPFLYPGLPPEIRFADPTGPLGEMCANCPNQGSKECREHIFGGKETHFTPAYLDLGRSPFKFMRDFFRDPFEDLLNGPSGFPRSRRISALSFRREDLPDFLKNLDKFPGIAGLDLGSLLSGGSGPESVTEVHLADFPPDELRQELLGKRRPHKLKEDFFTLGPPIPSRSREYIGVSGPQDVSLMVGPGKLISVPDILADAEICETIGPERVAILQEFADLFVTPPAEEKG